MSAPKLTEAQRARLKVLAKEPTTKFYHRLRGFDALERAGLVRFQKAGTALVGMSSTAERDVFQYALTDAGRAALRGES